MKQPISITAIRSISALGQSSETIWQQYQRKEHLLEQVKLDEGHVWVGALNAATKQNIERLRTTDTKYLKLDDSVLYAIYVARNAVKDAGWARESDFGINIGSSRGATKLFETYYAAYLRSSKAATLTSPTTTLGNIASWVAHDLNTQGPDISHSITCSTALHAMLNGIAWLQSGMASKFMVGGSEAPLTPFTVAQMKALKIYAKTDAVGRAGDDNTTDYPCQALKLDKKNNSMVLGEGAAVACLEIGNHENALALIEGIGYATEVLRHNISISTDAKCFQRSMKMALGEVDPGEVDLVVMHAPGTLKGDASEYKAIKAVFGSALPVLTTNKWKIGHTFGASGMLSIEMALLMFRHQECVAVPYLTKQVQPQKIDRILVNAVGFGGNAVSILLKNHP